MKNDTPEQVNSSEPTVPTTPPSAEPVTDTTNDTNTSVAMKPKAKRTLIAIVAVIVLVVIGAAAALYFMVVKPGSPHEAAQDSLAAATKFESAQSLIDTVAPQLSGAEMVVGKANGLGASDDNGFVAFSPPAHQTAGSRYFNLPLESSGVGYTGNSETAKKNYDALVAFFENNKFKRLASEKDSIGKVSVADAAAYDAYAEYESSDMLCAIRHADASSTELKAHVASVGCAQKASYDAASQKLEAFYKAYGGEDIAADVKLIFGVVDQGKGVGGYEYTVLFQQDASQFEAQEEADNWAFLGYYIKAPGENEWKYFKGAQEGTGLLLCSEFSDTASKSAFSNFACYDEKTEKETTVTL